MAHAGVKSGKDGFNYMKLYIVPIQICGFEKHDIAIRLRDGESPVLFMQDVNVTQDGYRESNRPNNQIASISIIGRIEDGITLQDGDVLLVQSRHSGWDESIEVNLEERNGIYLSENVEFTSIDIAARMEEQLCVCIADTSHKNTISTAVQIFNKVRLLYSEYPAFKNIMIKGEDGKAKDISLLSLIAIQDAEFVKWAETMVLSMDSKYKTLFPVAKQILEQAKTPDGFTLLSKEEQVAAFLEFSKRHADKAKEVVPDQLIDFLKKSHEYAKCREKLKQAGLGESQTQQFNVLQQVGYFGGQLNSVRCEKKSNVIYNLSDMGAGKTLMTVEAIFMLDCININAWNKSNKNEFVEVENIYLMDKHIIAPALSVKSSWVDTFRLFYDVEKDTDYHYILKMEFDGIKAISDLYIAPFTVRGGKISVHEKLPNVVENAYLIIDEIHQLIRRRISRTKFFVPGITPVLVYKIFALSGTMSNLMTSEWLSMIRFLGDTNILPTTADSNKCIEQLNTEYRENIENVAKDLEILQHKKFNVDNVDMETMYKPEPKKRSAVDIGYFTRYGSKLLIPRLASDGMPVQEMLSGRYYDIEIEPEDSDNVSFELFYRIAASSAITAQSLQIAEELFGKQKTQYKSSIIRTVSPFTNDEIEILNTLHKIAADSSKYRSANIGRDINNAILNLNDGLQQKDLYVLISEFAERNTRFFEYLASLDVNILERLPKTGLIKSPKLTDTHKFHVLKELLEKDKDETFLIVVNDFYAMKTLANALGVAYLSKQELKDEMSYQELLDGLFEKQQIVIVTQDMIKSSLDLVQANRLVQYQLNTEVSDIIQTQNRINRIGQTRETKCFYIAADRLQNALIELFLDSYRNIRVAHKGIVELFADLSSQIDVINDYLDVAFKKLEEEKGDVPEIETDTISDEIPKAQPENQTDLIKAFEIPKRMRIQSTNGICNAILFPDKEGISVIVPLKSGSPFRLGMLKPDLVGQVTRPTKAMWNLTEMKLIS